MWQYITLMRKIYLVDCPGVVPPSHETATDMILKGAVRTEYLKNPTDYIAPVLERVKRDYIDKTYQVSMSSLVQHCRYSNFSGPMEHFHKIMNY